MVDLWLQVHLRSDTTFGSGDGLAGVVHQEVQHDPATGLPQIKGRTLKGLLVEECANILYACEGMPGYERLEAAARGLFGGPGSTEADQGALHVGTGTLPRTVVRNTRRAIERAQLTPQDALEALTTIRYQTAVDQRTEVPQDNTLRAARAVLRETIFVAPLTTSRELSDLEIGLLAACAASARRGGLSRNRGRGRLEISLQGVEGDPAGWFADQLAGGAL